MALQVLTLYAAFEGGAEAAEVSIDIPGNGRITGVDWGILWDLDADGESFHAALSFASSNDLQNNDVRSLISMMSGGLASGAPAAGFYAASWNKFVSFMPGIPVFAGERLYLHGQSTAAATGEVHCLVHLDTTEMVVGSMRSASRRR